MTKTELRYIAMALVACDLACSGKSHAPSPTHENVGTTDAPLIGDANGPAWANTVSRLQTHPLPTLPASLEFLGYNGSNFVYASGASIFTPGADLAGNGTSTATAQYVSSISYSSSPAGGVVGINGTGTTFAIASNNTGFALAQTATSALNATAANLFFDAQQSTNGSSTSGKSGDIVFNVGAPPGTSATEAFVRYQRNGVDEVWFGADPAAPTDVGIWFGSATPTGGNFSFLGNPSGGQVYLSAPNWVFLDTASAAVSVDSATGAFERSDVIPATTLGSSAKPWPQAWANGYFFNASDTTAQLTQQAQVHGSALAPQALLIEASFQSGSDEGSPALNTPGPIVLNYGAPFTTSNAGSETFVKIQRNSSTVAAIGAWPAAPATYDAIWMGPGIVPSSTNFAFLGDGVSQVYLNAPSSAGSINFQLANASIVGWAQSAGTVYQEITNTYNSVFEFTGPSAPTQPPHYMQFIGEGPDLACTSSANCTPGGIYADVALPGGTGGTAGAEGYFYVQRGGVQYAAIGAYFSIPGSYAQLTLGPGISGTNNFTVISDGASTTYYNGYATGVLHLTSVGSIFEWTGSGLFPGTDNIYEIGSASLRVQSESVGPGGFNVWHTSGNASPTAQLGDAKLLFGSTSTQDTSIVRSVAGVVQVSNNGNGDAEVDVGGTSSANEISIISSLTTVKVAGTGASGVAANGLTLATQTVNAAAGSSSGNLGLVLGLPGTGGTEGYVGIYRGSGNEEIALGPLPGSGATAGAGWFVPGTTPSGSNWTIGATSSQTGLNAPTGGTIAFDINNSAELSLTSTTFNPVDNAIVSGQKGSRWKAIATAALGLSVYLAQNDADPSTQLSSQSLTMGQGGAHLPDGELIRIGSGNWQLDDFNGGAFTLNLGGTSATGSSSIVVPGPSSSITGTDLQLFAQNSSGANTGTNHGGNIWLFSGGINSAPTGIGGDVVASMDTNTSHHWTPNGAYSTFQVIDRSGLDMVVGNLDAASGGNAAFSAIWLGSGTTSFTPSNTNYSFANDGGGLNYNGALSHVWRVAGTSIMSASSNTFFPSTAGGMSLGSSSLPWGASFLGGSSSGYHDFEAPLTNGGGGTQSDIGYHRVGSVRTNSQGPAAIWQYTFTSQHAIDIIVHFFGKVAVVNGSGLPQWGGAGGLYRISCGYNGTNIIQFSGATGCLVSNVNLDSANFTLTASVSGATMTVNVNYGVASNIPTIDWALDAWGIVD